MRKLYILIILVYYVPAYGQTYKQDKFEETVHGLTTIINVLKSGNSELTYSTFGTGFFFHQYDSLPKSTDSLYNTVNSNLKKIWLVTNKHVLFGKANSELSKPPFPPAIEFYMRKKIKNRTYPRWDTIRIKESDLKLTTRLHRDTLVDVVAIDVTNNVLPRLLKGDSLFFYGAVSKVNFPNPNLPVSVIGETTRIGTEVLSIGYPRNFYDKVNLFPTVKAGIIASKWKMNYNGRPYFLIDSKLFPGSSGSIVITRSVMYATGKENTVDYFQFLGVFSGEPFKDNKPIEFDDVTIIRRETYNIGIVWYYDLIEEIIR